jgi:[pyruvate, water dikinase]-phosphate phosphotransferase / [pyruvate, water dikinase] kinase
LRSLLIKGLTIFISWVQNLGHDQTTHSITVIHTLRDKAVIVMNDKIFHLHLVSDATGETINGVARACLAQFEQTEVREYFWNLIRTPRQLDMVLEGLKANPGLVLYTFVDESLRRKLEEFCRNNKLHSAAVLDPVMTAMNNYFGVAATHRPGRQHALDAEYFARIDAMDFALAFDDGHGTTQLMEADVIILGVSRTSKTPTCVYLANRGIRAANIPVIPGASLPEDLPELAATKLVIGLTREAESLAEIRHNRLKWLDSLPVGRQQTAYVDPEQVQIEVQEARRLYARLGIPVIDVTRRSIEETAAEIMMLLQQKQRAAESTAP